jgi:hypothetical protein
MLIIRLSCLAEHLTEIQLALWLSPTYEDHITQANEAHPHPCCPFVTTSALLPPQYVSSRQKFPAVSRYSTNKPYGIISLLQHYKLSGSWKLAILGVSAEQTRHGQNLYLPLHTQTPYLPYSHHYYPHSTPQYSAGTWPFQFSRIRGMAQNSPLIG